MSAVDERAARILEAVREATKVAGVIDVRGDADVTWDKTTDPYNGWPEILRAVVEACGFTAEMVEDLEAGAVLLGFSAQGRECPLHPIADALSALRRAAGLTEDGGVE